MSEAQVLHVFGGKGGSGKTTLSAGFALNLSEQFAKDKVLLVSADPAGSLSDLVKKKLGLKPQKLVPGKGDGGLFAAEFARRRRWIATAITLVCFVAFAVAGYLTHYARATTWPTLASADIPLTASLPLRGAKMLEGVVYVFAPFPMFAATWWGPIAAFALYAVPWLVIAGSLDRAHIRSAATLWLLALAVSMCVPFVFASEVRVTAEAVVFAWLALASMARWGRGARWAVVAILTINLAAIGLNYRTFESRVYDVRARPVEKDLSQPAYQCQAWREGMRQRMLAALGLPVRPRPVQ
jgi:hypothetical protein